MKILQILKPLMYLAPEVSRPDQRLGAQERLLWTGIALIVFLVLNQLPLFGVSTGSSPNKSSWDPFYQQRIIMASNRGTLMEFGLSSILTSGLLMQFLTGARVFEVNYALKEDRMLLAGAQKLLCIGISFVQAVLFLGSGMSGLGFVAGGKEYVPNAGAAERVLSSLTTVPGLVTGTVGNETLAEGAAEATAAAAVEIMSTSTFYVIAALIVFQLVVTNVILMSLDEMVQRGYGLGSGVSLFLCTSVSMQTVWNAVSPISRDLGHGSEFIGAIPALPHLLYARENKALALLSAFFRPGLPNLWTLIVVIGIGAAVAFLQNWRVDIPVKYPLHRSASGNFPIKLFYTSNIPVILTSVLVANLLFLSQVIACLLPNSVLTSLTGSWQPSSIDPDIRVPISGLAYFISPPASFLAVVWDPFHTIFYISFILSTCAIFSKAWTEVSGTNPKGVARTLRDQNMIIKGHRDTALEHELSRYIPTAAAFGGVLVGGASVLGDVLGCAGVGSATLLATTTIFQYYEIFLREFGPSGLIPGLMDQS